MESVLWIFSTVRVTVSSLFFRRRFISAIPGLARAEPRLQGRSSAGILNLRMARKRRPPSASSILWIVTECSERAGTALLILLSFVNPFYLRQERKRKKNHGWQEPREIDSGKPSSNSSSRDGGEKRRKVVVVCGKRCTVKSKVFDADDAW